MPIVSAIQQGDEKAFESAYSLYKDKLYCWLLGKMRSEYLAQEVLQQTFIKIWVSRENLSVDLAFDIQMFRTARSLMIDQLRKIAHEKNAMSGLVVPEADDHILHQYNARETRLAIDRILNTLPETGRKSFLLSRDYGLSYNDIARELSISPKTVEYHISRALSLLRKLIPLFLILLCR